MSAYVLDSTGAEKEIKLTVSPEWPQVHKLKNGAVCSIGLLDRANESEISAIHSILKHEIEAGTYPQKPPMDRSAFLAYYCSHTVLVARDSVTHKVLGSVYIKPNFPGRCSHICNGGFLVDLNNRGNGVGRALAKSFEDAARILGYKAIFFNLVFTDNPASYALWNSLGYKQAGSVPSAKKLESGKYIDAYMMHKLL